MKKLIRSTIFICLSIVFLQDTQAVVYESHRSFNAQDELLYSEWIKLKLESDIFSNPQSPYFGIKTDCADAVFALRAIYAFENKLSIRFIAEDGKVFTEKSTRFNHLSSVEIVKLKAFIEFVGENIGSEVLASENSYPISIQSIRPGDMYIAKWTNPEGEIGHHVYLIKDILPTGDFLLYSSTRPRAIRPFLTRKGMPLKGFRGEPFGFRRFLPAGEKINLSFVQYEMIKQGESIFFKQVKQTLKVSEDTYADNINRRIENICTALVSRIDIVESALIEKKKLEGKCFKKDQFDEFSTPSRDRNIILEIERLRNGYKTIVSNNISVQIDEITTLGLNYLIGIDKNIEDSERLKELCDIKIEIQSTQKINYTIKTFYDRHKAGMISSNPNDSFESRWGLKRSQKTCPTF